MPLHHVLHRLLLHCCNTGADRVLDYHVRAVEAVAQQVRLKVGGEALRKRGSDRRLAPGIAYEERTLE